LEEKSQHVINDEESGVLVGLEEIGGILSRLYPATSPMLQAVDAKGQDYGTYYLVAFSDTSDLDRSLTVYRHIKNLVRFIILTDRFYENGNPKYRRAGRAIIARLREENDQHLTNPLTYYVKQAWPFWSFEQRTRDLLVQGHAFSRNEIKRYSLFKSSDAALIYAPLLEDMLPNFSRNVSTIMHYNQALQDIDDDLDDVMEDLEDQMPNLLILAAMQKERSADAFSRLREHRLNGSSKFILENAADAVRELVDEYAASVEGISIPSQFRFLKHLSRHYARTIGKKLTATRTSIPQKPNRRLRHG